MLLALRLHQTFLQPQDLWYFLIFLGWGIGWLAIGLFWNLIDAGKPIQIGGLQGRCLIGYLWSGWHYFASHIKERHVLVRQHVGRLFVRYSLSSWECYRSLNRRKRLTAATEHFRPIVADLIESLVCSVSGGLRLLFFHVEFERKFAHLRQLLLFLKQLIYFVLPLFN